MSGTFSYVWDRQTECWQIVSRSGHIVYQSEVKEQVRLMCQQLESRCSQSTSPCSASAIKPSRAATCQVIKAKAAPAKRLPILSWPVLVTALGLVLGATLAMVPPRKDASRAMASEVYRATLPVQRADAYQVVWQTEMQERHVRVAKPVVETKEVEQRVKVLRPVVETQEREEIVLVRRPVIETSVRYEKFTINEPVTTYETKKLDQGRWAEPVVTAPVKSTTSVRWVPGGYSTDAATGVTSWKLPMFRLVQEPVVVAHQAQRVWQPNVTQTQVPRTTYRQRIETRPVQVQTVRYVEEKQVRKIPVKVQRMVEDEEVRKVPVTTSRMTYEDRVERVPVKVCRRVPVGQAAPPTDSSNRAASDLRTDKAAVESKRAGSEVDSERAHLDEQQPKPNTPEAPSKPRTKSRLQPEMRHLETERVAQRDAN